ncbi:MAG: carboxymuconolactone decarboxylase family protein [Bryobacteraceae bacterium]
MIEPVKKEDVAPELVPLYEKLSEKFGMVPGIFGVMAHRPGALLGMAGINNAVMEKGTIEPRYRELAYLKASTVNGCEY